MAWRGAIFRKTDLEDFTHILSYRKNSAYMKNMGFISALADKDVALAILREHYNEVQIEDFSKGKTDQSELASINN